MPETQFRERNEEQVQGLERTLEEMVFVQGQGQKMWEFLRDLSGQDLSRGEIVQELNLAIEARNDPQYFRDLAEDYNPEFASAVYVLSQNLNKGNNPMPNVESARKELREIFTSSFGRGVQLRDVGRTNLDKKEKEVLASIQGQTYVEMEPVVIAQNERQEKKPDMEFTLEEVEEYEQQQQQADMEFTLEETEEYYSMSGQSEKPDMEFTLEEVEEYERQQQAKFDFLNEIPEQLSTTENGVVKLNRIGDIIQERYGVTEQQFLQDVMNARKAYEEGNMQFFRDVSNARSEEYSTLLMLTSERVNIEGNNIKFAEGVTGQNIVDFLASEENRKFVMEGYRKLWLEG